MHPALTLHVQVQVVECVYRTTVRFTVVIVIAIQIRRISVVGLRYGCFTVGVISAVVFLGMLIHAEMTSDSDEGTSGLIFLFGPPLAGLGYAKMCLTPALLPAKAGKWLAKKIKPESEEFF